MSTKIGAWKVTYYCNSVNILSLCITRFTFSNWAWNFSNVSLTFFTCSLYKNSIYQDIETTVQSGWKIQCISTEWQTILTSVLMEIHMIPTVILLSQYFHIFRKDFPLSSGWRMNWKLIAIYFLRIGFIRFSQFETLICPCFPQRIGDIGMHRVDVYEIKLLD